MSLRQYIVALVAGILRVTVTFSQPQKEEEVRKPRDKDYRLSRRVWYDGTVHWKIEQYVSSLLTLKTLFPDYPTKGMMQIGGKPAPRDWIPLPQDFASEEEAIEYLNETLRSCEVMEVSHIYID